jgi:hypothetical protein
MWASNSTLMIVSIPIFIWTLLPENPAYRFLGFVKGENQIPRNRTNNDFVWWIGSIRARASEEAIFAEIVSDPEETSPRLSGIYPVSSDKKRSYICLVEGCNSTEVFRRKNDLDRHLTAQHERASNPYYCTHTKCKDRGIKFTKKEQYDHHLRASHR